jgi:PadR family transcriptional regulator, regulatory protein PadR
MRIQRYSAGMKQALQVLKAARQPIWGRELARKIGRQPGGVFPMLHRLKRAGLVASEWEKRPSRYSRLRRFYTLTEEGGHAADRFS